MSSWQFAVSSWQKRRESTSADKKDEALPMTTISKVLIANRGEIACRVIEGARKLGYPTVAVYSDADAGARHVEMADEAVYIGPSVPAESYLKIENILEAAERTGANAVHPGYGFLAENAEFAKACTDAGLVFVGPPAEAIDLMGNKAAAKRRMQEADVPCVPGYEGEDQSDETLIEQAKQIGLPVMVKAAAGGGGRGMRLVEHEEKLGEAIKSARSEAKGAFGSEELIIEKAVQQPRHVEIQIVADSQGNVVHLGERDCSIQRRHQKVVEESPSPAVDAELRAKMGEAAVAAAQAIGYVNAGTVEFLLAPDRAFYFMEMNTRLQVEHPVTELVTGIDLVEWQLRVAAGEALPLRQDQITFNGHAIEVRLCAEDAFSDFMPQSGPVLLWQPAEQIRVDHGLRSPGHVSSHYDSMVAKLIAHGDEREAARRKLLHDLEETVLLGLVSNRDLLAAILRHEVFAQGDFDTGFIQEHFPQDRISERKPATQHVAIAAALLYQTDALALQANAHFSDEVLGWHSSHPYEVNMKLRWRETDFELWLQPLADGSFTIKVAESDRFDISLELTDSTCAGYVCGEVHGRADFVRSGNDLWLACEGAIWAYTDRSLIAAETADEGGDGRLLAPSDGKVIEVRAKQGDQVEKGQTLVVVEAMKMEFQVTSGVAGSVSEINVAAGDQVSARQLLALVEAAETEKTEN